VEELKYAYTKKAPAPRRYHNYWNQAGHLWPRCSERNRLGLPVFSACETDHRARGDALRLPFMVEIFPINNGTLGFTASRSESPLTCRDP